MRKVIAVPKRSKIILTNQIRKGGFIAMPTYISLLRYTEQGIKNIKESPARLDAARDLFKTMGADLKAFYLVTGKYDAVCIAEAPDGATVAKVMLTLGSKGNVRTETFEAFKEEEFRKIVGSLS
jgi:uncharacterized protein with GYD domain